MTVHRLEAGQRAVFVAQPSGGKTNLQMALLLTGVESAVVIDSKRHPREWPPFAAQHGYLVTSDPDQLGPQNAKVIFQPSHQALMDRNGWRNPSSQGYQWTRALATIKARRRPTVVVFDEVIQSLPAGAAHPVAVELYTQGAAWGISCWAGTQVPNRMETLVIRLAEHGFFFWTGNAADQRMIASCRSVDADLLGSLEKHHFAYHRAGEREMVVCEPAPLVVTPRSYGAEPVSGAGFDRAATAPEAAAEPA